MKKRAAVGRVEEVGVPVDTEERAKVLERLVQAFERAQRERLALEQHASAHGLLHPAVEWAHNAFATMEREAIRWAERLLRGDRTYEWLVSIRGVGTILAMQVIGVFPLHRFASPGKMWALAGLVPGSTNYSRRHKEVATKLSMSQVMSRGDYRPLYEQRKRYEWRRNLSGELADQARQWAKSYGKDTNAYLWASGKVDSEWAQEWLASGKPFPIKLPQEAITDRGVPMLAPAHIEARARRWMAKLMLDHYFQVAYYYKTGERWVPWVIAHGGHVDKIEPVNAPWLIEPVNAPWR